MRTYAGFLAVLLCATALGDVVHLVGGGKVEGRIVEESGTTVVVNVRGGRVTVAREKVESIERTPVSEAPAAPRTATPPETVRVGAHFRVRCHLASETVADDALAAAEAAWPATEELLGVSVDAPKEPVDVHVHATGTSFAAAVGDALAREATGAADPEGRFAHVRLMPEVDASVWARVGTPRWFVTSVAHETSHVAFARALPALGDSRTYPAWLVEGIAKTVARRVLVAERNVANVASDPLVSADMTSCLRLRREGLLPEPRAIFQGRLDHLDAADRYAVWGAFFELLERPEHAARTRKVLDALRALPAGGDAAARIATIAEETWGAKGLDELNDAFRALVDTYHPEWDLRGWLDAARDPHKLQFASNDTDPSRAWRRAAAGKADYAVAGMFEMLEGDAPRVEVDLGANEAGYVAVVFDPSVGVRVREFVAAEGTWRTLEGRVLDSGVVGRKAEFEIRVTKDGVLVRLGGRDTYAAALGGRDLSGPWGLGVGGGTMAVWSAVGLR